VEGKVRDAVLAAGPAIWRPAGHQDAPPPDLSLVDVVPLSHGWLAIGRTGDEILVAPLLEDRAHVRRATPGDGVFAALGHVVGHPVPGLTGHPVGTANLGGRERSLGDHTNELAVIGERSVVKVFARTSPGPQPAVDLPAHLAAVGFSEMPAPIGSVWWKDALVATVTTYVPGALDGWDWYVAAVEAAVLGEVAWAAVGVHAIAIGGLVARLHRALASPSEVLPTPVEEADAERIAAWRRAAEATLDTASALTDGPEGERLRAIAPAAHVALAALDRVTRTPIMRIHGDLHVGQILRSPDDRLRVNDFDGNPLAPVAGRIEPQAPARDVAWMLAAIDHVGRVVARRHPEAEGAITSWIEPARDAFLAAYRDGLGDRRELLDDRLLDPFAVAQEAHEFVYAARYQPGWRSVPDAALPAVLVRSAARSSFDPVDRGEGRSIG